MILAPRHRSTVLIAFAVSLFLGMTLTPPTGEGAAALLETMRQHEARVYATGLFRTLAVILVVPAVAAIGAVIKGRGERLFRLAAIALYLGSLAGMVVITQMVFQLTVLAPLPDQSAALAIAEAIEGSLLWQISVVPYLLGYLVGFVLLGIAVWRAGLGRLIGVAIPLGLLIHIAVGDWPVTSVGGGLVECGGLIALGLRIRRSTTTHPSASGRAEAQSSRR